MPRATTGKKPGAAPSANCFTAESLKFIRGLARNNDREWFEPRRTIYESALRQPMLALIATVNEQMIHFAPEHVKAPQKTVLRIYRDTRFSKNKLPYKQHYAAWWGSAGMMKTSGAGFYFHLSARTLVIAAGLYMPDPVQLLAVRRYLLDHHAEFRSLLAARKLRTTMKPTDAQALTRAPKGFAAEHPAIDLILCRNWGVEAELPSDAALDEKFALTLAGYFQTAAPVVAFLNRPLARSTTTRTLFRLPSM